jgi:hypothetical protein
MCPRILGERDDHYLARMVQTKEESIVVECHLKVLWEVSNVPEQNNAGSAKSNATPQIQVFTILACEFDHHGDWSDISYTLYLDSVGTTWCKVFLFP